MRNIQKLIAFVFVFVVWSCTTDDFVTQDKESLVTAKNNSSENTSRKSFFFPTYSDTSMVVQYKAGTPDAEKNNIRTFNGVGNYEICHCDNQDIELWYFGGVIDAEPKRRAIKGQIDPESTTGLLEVDYEFVFGLDLDSPFIGTDADTGYIPYIKTVNTGITIAIVDTGIATGLTVFNTGMSPNQFLYNAEFTEISGDKSGWDFVNEDANAYDDDIGKHGSIIANMITDALTANAIPHQILPVKVANASGGASYFDFLCGTLYAAERADIVSISMGWYDEGDEEDLSAIFSNIIEANNDVIMITSAGNLASNNDMLNHFPSSYEHNNVIAVASANSSFTKISDFSNYGAISVDYFALGEGIPFYDVSVQGTSFAAPQVTIEVANIFDDLGILPPEDLKEELNSRGTTVITDFTLLDGEYRNTLNNKYIIPFD
ncbi:S8/S53 family peptidase [Kordia sp. YSTF-M3]|uniref:S8/S53 family peptidase n=1 Tax=Kordia aestuariivivens TaxID=2759037 RepID=A0ABR7Q7S4_9FLAO|nr:S8/S53 family peptidase [Kordia aestuariivivens]MBC8754616.1 S8/S53 family peptidase [Kordia aestuariivivens]